MTDSLSNTNQRDFKKETIVFLVLVFLLTYAFDGMLMLKRDALEGQRELFQGALRVQMMLPALSAILVGFFFKDPAYKGVVRVFLVFFILLVLLAAILVPLMLFLGYELPVYAGMINNVLFFGLTVLVLVVFQLRKSWREDLRRAGLGLGQAKYYMLFWLLVVGFYVLSAVLNLVFGLAEPVSKALTINEALYMGASVAFITPLISLLTYFGEEYGWRIFLQDRLVALFGSIKGVILVGLVWGLWHAPMVIFFDWTYPGYPVLGPVLFTVFTVEMSIFLGWAMLRSRSVWLASFIHAVNNVFASFLFTVLIIPRDNAFAFGPGLYGLLILAVPAALLLRFGNWQHETEKSRQSARNLTSHTT